MRETDESTPVGRLIFAVAGLADLGDGGGPEHNGALREACRRLRSGQPVEWDSRVAWDTLGAIRSDLDLLPESRTEGLITPDQVERIESSLNTIIEGQTVKEWYGTSEVGRILNKAEYTVREWCRQGRVQARKKPCGRGKGGEWLVSHEELTRLKNEGLLPPSHGTR